MPELTSSTARVVVLPELGGRISSLEINGTQVIAGQGDTHGSTRRAFDWGLYPMVPFAGRVRNARFVLDGASHGLVARAAPHAIHGTVDDTEWSVTSSSASKVSMESVLGPAWPFEGSVRHVIALSESAVEFRLSLTAGETMPAQVGWHPWFLRPATVSATFAAWQPRDEEGMPTAPTTDGMPPLSADLDDCFVGGEMPVRVTTCGVTMDLWSDCSHWVVYSGADHGICVEPQSGPPNAIEAAPLILRAGEMLERSFRISW